MTRPERDRDSPWIRVTVRGKAVTIEQHRPPILSTLAGLEVDQALERVPTLLPVCGVAQSVAAARAVEAASGREPEGSTERERQLWREQALAAGWRLAVDWPDLLARDRPLAWLKQLRSSEDDRTCADLLSSALPGLARVSDVDGLLAWAERRESTAASLVAAARERCGDPVAAATDCCEGSALAALARSRLSAGSFDPAAAVVEAVEVGPLAMARDPLVEQVKDRFGRAGIGRLLALVLDIRHIGRRLAVGEDSDAAGIHGWNEGEGIGVGRAMTARGPVYHRVALDRSGRVLDWRSLVPTDWHFAPGGPVAALLAGCRDGLQGRLLVAGFDPCVPCSLDLQGEH